jgi:hypothetical protein
MIQNMKEILMMKLSNFIMSNVTRANGLQQNTSSPQFGAGRVYLMRPNNGSTDDYLERNRNGIEVAAKLSNLRSYRHLERPDEFTGDGKNGPEEGDYILFNPAHQEEHVYRIREIYKTGMHFESILDVVPNGDAWIEERSNR